MIKNNIKKCLVITMISAISIQLLVGCNFNEKQKEVILSQDIRDDIKEEEKESEILKIKAQEYLAQGDYNQAKELYNKVILMDKGNKDLYLEIKDNYISVNRFDDAYEVVKVAIDNNVDTEEMIEISKDIQKSFEVIEYNYTVEIGEKVALPTEGTINLRGESINVPIKWNVDKVDTASKGIFNYEGVNSQYGRVFKASVEVIYKPLTEAEVRNITARAKNALTDVINCLNFDENSMISVDGRTFAISNNFKTRNEVLNHLYPYYTDKIINDFLQNKTFEKDGIFYVVYGQGGLGLSVETDDLVIEQTETTLKAVYTKIIGEDTVRQEFDFIKYKNEWIRSDIRLYS